MATLNIEDRYLNWVNEHIIPSFSERGVTVTPEARRLIAFSLQAQVSEHYVTTADAALNRAQEMARVGPTVFRNLFGNADQLNYNRTLHLMVRINAFLRGYLWEPTV